MPGGTLELAIFLRREKDSASNWPTIFRRSRVASGFRAGTFPSLGQRRPPWQAVAVHHDPDGRTDLVSRFESTMEMVDHLPGLVESSGVCTAIAACAANLKPICSSAGPKALSIE